MPAFTEILNISIRASWLVPAVILARFLLKRAPKAVHCAMWALVAIRLILPVSIESHMSVIPSREIIPEQYLVLDPGEYDVPARLDVVTNPVFPTDLTIDTGTTVDRLQTWDVAATVVWLAGAGAMAVYALYSYLNLRLKVRLAFRLDRQVCECDEIETPFILGLIRPRIYLPSSLDEATRAHVLAHERAHLQRLDHVWKPLGFALLNIHWFNPLLWLAYILLCRDIELACDEKVVKKLDRSAVRAYSEALVRCAVSHRMIAVCPLAFGEVGVKGRIKSMLNYKKPTFWVLVAAVVLSVCLAVGFLTDPPSPTGNTNLPEVPPEGVRTLSEAYVLNNRDPGAPYFLLREDGAFTLVQDANMAEGQYKSTDSTLTLHAEDGRVWSFWFDEFDRLRYDSQRSAPLSAVYQGSEVAIADGAYFNPMPAGAGEHAMGITGLEPQNELISGQALTVESGGTISYLLNYVSADVELEISLVNGKGEHTFVQTAELGYRQGNFTNLPAGDYRICVKNISDRQVASGRIDFTPSDHTCDLLDSIIPEPERDVYESYLDAFITQTIEAYFRTTESDSRICVSDFIRLDQTELCLDGSDPMIMHTVYLLACYQEYHASGHVLYPDVEECTPAIITIEDRNGEYTLKEFWIPEDGDANGDNLVGRMSWKALDVLHRNENTMRENLKRRCQDLALLRVDALIATAEPAYIASTGFAMEGLLTGPSFSLCSDGTFTLHENPLSSFLHIGTYTLGNGLLVLRSENSGERWVFEATQNGYRYLRDRSNEIVYLPDLQTPTTLLDGMEFVAGETWLTASDGLTEAITAAIRSSFDGAPSIVSHVLLDARTACGLAPEGQTGGVQLLVVELAARFDPLSPEDLTIQTDEREYLMAKLTFRLDGSYGLVDMTVGKNLDTGILSPEALEFWDENEVTILEQLNFLAEIS